jgi:hypothetical protein
MTIVVRDEVEVKIFLSAGNSPKKRRKNNYRHTTSSAGKNGGFWPKNVYSTGCNGLLLVRRCWLQKEKQRILS